MLFSLLAIFSCNKETKPIVNESLKERAGLPHFFDKIKKNNDIKIVYFGGSITNHEGYRKQSFEWFQSKYPNSKFSMVNASIGGTGSDLGVFRIDQDVIKHKPDLVFVEFAVNDSKTDSLTVSRSMEGIVRKLKNQCPKTDICFLYTINWIMLNDMTKGQLYQSIRYMENIAEYYNIPSINFGKKVVKLLQEDKLIFEGDKNTDYGNKIVFTYDGTHPTIHQGHLVYTGDIKTAFTQMESSKIKHVEGVPKALYPNNYELAKLFPIKEFEKSDGWKLIPKNDNLYKYYQKSSKYFDELYYTNNPEDYITFKFKGSMIGLFDVIGPSSSGITIKLNDDVIPVRRFDKYCGTRYRSHYKLLPSIEDKEYTVTIQLDTTSFDKKSIYNEFKKGENIKEEHLFTQNNAYLGEILLIGEIIK